MTKFLEIYFQNFVSASKLLIINKLCKYNKNLISGGKVYGIIFFSSQVVKLFCKDIKKVPDGFVFFCISDRVAENLIKSKILGKYKIKIAKKPNQEHVIDLICKEKLLSF